MANYLWPLGDNYNSEYMDTDNFLKNCRRVTKSKYYNTVQWRCQPGYVPFNYVTNYYPVDGVAQSVTASGAFTENGVILNPSFHNFAFPDNYISVFNQSRNMVNTNEGVKLTKLYYRINDGKWMELSTDLKNISFDFSNNGDKVEIKATYQVWTMGDPHSPIPFVWLGSIDGIYNNGNNNFTDVVPVNPGRKYSGMMNYCNGKDYNADWKLQSISWYAPGSTMLESNWTYQNAMAFRKEAHNKIGIFLNTWSDTMNCQKFDDTYMNKTPGYYGYIYQYGWMHNYPSYNTADITTGWWKSPYKTRKSMWWIYEKTFSDVYIASDIEQQQSATPVRNASLKVVQDDRTATFSKEGKWLNGTTGKLLVEFNGPNLAFVDIYAVQKVSAEEIMEVKIISGEAITSGIVNTFEIKFSDYPQLRRSKDIAYYMKVFTVSGGFVKYEYEPIDTSYTAIIANGTHYYNDEPAWISNVKIQRVKTYSDLSDDYSGTTEDLEQSINRKELYRLTWDAPKDPDGHPVQYSFLVDGDEYESVNFSTSDDYKLLYGIQDKWTIRSKRGSTGVAESISINAKNTTINMTGATSALYVLPTSRLQRDSNGDFINPLNLWIIPHDGRTNDYYYGTRVNLLQVGYDPVVVEVVDGAKYDEATLKLTHSDSINTAVNVKVYAFMSTHPDDKTSGKYIGAVYDGLVEPGETTLKVSLFDKINGQQKIKRGHYIKYAITCKELNQTFNPYAEDAWELASGYHRFNQLPTPSTPFLCEDNITVFKDGIAKIAWNESIDADNTSPVNYYLYIAAINKPELNTFSDGFWINDEESTSYEVRRFYKIINMGSTVHTKDMPYTIEMSEFVENDSVNMWIVAKDTNRSSRYLTGDTTTVGDSSLRMSVPIIRVTDAKAYNLLEKTHIDGEAGNIQVMQNNSLGKDAIVTLYAICKKIDGPNAGDMKLFNEVATWNLKSGEWSQDTKILFKVAFGEEWSNSHVRYHAVAVAADGTTTYDPSMMTVDAWDRWIGEHVYNEQPTPLIIRSGDRTDLHSNIHIAWSYQINEDFRELNNVELVEGVHDPSTPKVFH